MVDGSFPDRLTYKMLKELGSIYDDFNSHSNINQMKREGNKLISKFNNPQSFDKLTKASENV